MKKVEIFDPALCCSSGVCGPSVDPALVEFAGVVKHVEEAEIPVDRYNLSQQPQAFVDNQEVSKLLKEKGKDALPYIFVDNKLVFSGSYPSIEEFCKVLEIKSSKQQEEVAEETSCCGGGEC